jgi:mannosyltransferase OCH1-like enzyme
MIPKVIHQIWIGDQSKRPTEAMETIKKDNPDCEYKLWTEKELNTLKISKKLELKIKCMEEICGKCDIYRYLILKEYGGIYIDADSVSIEPLDEFFFKNCGMAFENEYCRQDLLALGFLAFPPNHPLMNDCITHIESNKIQSPAWIHTGNIMITNIIKEKKYQFNFYPSYYFYPEHHTRHQYKGHGKVYLTQLWGSTHNRYGNSEFKIQPFLLEPKTCIDIIIPDDTSKKKMKDILQGIKNMDGHYKIKIHTKEDISQFIKQTRFITHIKED